MEHRLKKQWLNINGADRMVVYDYENDSLADVLRRIGLTGTKIGCGIGVCGACSVVLNGEVVRACSKKMKKVEDFDQIVTIEGIGTAMHLHPLQKAFLKYGGLQCGICTPGFIVSAYGLLAENPDPTREEVRMWFHDHKNYCRCTGYKQIVDAVMAAAPVMRGEADESTLDFDVEKENNGRYYNSRMPRPSGLGKVTGTLDYGEDASLKMPPGLLHAAIVQPRVTRHANILAIHTEEAEKMPGVVKVITGDTVRNELGGTNMIDQFSASSAVSAPTREILCDKKIKRYGDVIALVVADTREHARAAAKKVTMDFEQLPELTAPTAALRPDAPSVNGFPNVYTELGTIKGENPTDIIAEAPYSVEGHFYVQHEPHLSIEGDALIAYEDEDGNLAIQCKSQSIYGNHALLGKTIGLPDDKVRVLQHGAVGASFGWSCDYTDQAMVAIAARAVDAPVSLVMSWEEHSHYAGKRTSATINAQMSCDAEGHINGLKYSVAGDHGAYVEFSDNGNYNRVGTPYYVPNIRGFFQMYSSNNNHCTAWRGFGMPQTNTFTEQLMDMLAEKAGIDPFEFRLRNIMRGDQTSPVGGVYLNAHMMEKIMMAAKPYYDELKATVHNLDTDTVKHGVGISMATFFPTMGTWDKASASVEIRKDNCFYVHNTYHEMGQGGDICNMITMLETFKEYNIPPERIHIDINDSKNSPDSGISAQSRSFVMNCGAINEAAKLLIAAMKKEDGTLRTYEEMVAEGIDTLYEATYQIQDPQKTAFFRDKFSSQGQQEPTPGFAFNVAHVAVDTTTGKTQVLGYRSWSDCGVIGNYLGAEGQAYGGIVQNIGYALTEDYLEDKKYGNINGCGLTSAANVPDDFEVHFLEDYPRPGTPFGSNGMSEVFFAGQNFAILNGIYNATGVRIYEQPALPEKVLDGLAHLAKGEEVPMPAPYFRNYDLDEKIEELEENLDKFLVERGLKPAAGSDKNTVMEDYS